MTTKYPYKIDGKDFNVIRRDELDKILPSIGKIPQNGIRYPGNNTTVFSSHTQDDIKDAILHNDGWAHSRCARRLKVGDTVIVVPNASELNKYGNDAVGIKFTATSLPYRVDTDDCQWTSD